MQDVVSKAAPVEEPELLEERDEVGDPSTQQGHTSVVGGSRLVGLHGLEDLGLDQTEGLRGEDLVQVVGHVLAKDQQVPAAPETLVQGVVLLILLGDVLGQGSTSLKRGLSYTGDGVAACDVKPAVDTVDQSSDLCVEFLSLESDLFLDIEVVLEVEGKVLGQHLGQVQKVLIREGPIGEGLHPPTQRVGSIGGTA